MSLETDLANHKTQCVTDKAALTARLDSIDNKLWACVGIVLINLFVVVGYLITEGTPWTQGIEIADRGERK